jgi:hypothetical protein
MLLHIFYKYLHTSSVGRIFLKDYNETYYSSTITRTCLGLGTMGTKQNSHNHHWICSRVWQ